MATEFPDYPDDEISYPGVEALELTTCLFAELLGREGRVATVAHLRQRLEGVGRKVTASVVTLALMDLQLRLNADPVFPFTLQENGTQWRFVPRHAALEVLAGSGKIKTQAPLKPRELEVLTVVIHSQGITASGIERIMGFDPVKAIEVLHAEGLIYAVPGKFYRYWRPCTEILRRWNYRRWTDVPGFAENHAYLHGKGSKEEALGKGEKEIKKAVKSGLWKPSDEPKDEVE